MNPLYCAKTFIDLFMTYIHACSSNGVDEVYHKLIGLLILNMVESSGQYAQSGG